MKKISTCALLLSTLVVTTQLNAATVSGTSTFNISDDSQSFVSSYETSTINLNSGADVAFLYAYDSSTVNLNNGSDVSHLHAYDDATVKVFGGEISFLNLHDNSSANIFNSDISWLDLDASATATIYGTNFDYSDGHLSGNWTNGTAFSFWALINNPISGMPPIISSTLPSNITLSSVPLPPSIFLFASVLFPLLRRAKKNSKKAAEFNANLKVA